RIRRGGLRMTPFLRVGWGYTGDQERIVKIIYRLPYIVFYCISMTYKNTTAKQRRFSEISYVFFRNERISAEK
ncbi:MAG: hypothetical protein ABI778_07535, partial [Ignavibacteriota bacterium]